MRRMVEKLLRQFGEELLVGGQPARGLFQSVTGKWEHLARMDVGPIGWERRKRFVYIGPLEPEAREDMVIVRGGKEYLIRAVQEVQGAYLWAICVEKGREDTWGQSS